MNQTRDKKLNQGLLLLLEKIRLIIKKGGALIFCQEDSALFSAKQDPLSKEKLFFSSHALADLFLKVRPEIIGSFFENHRQLP